MWIFLNDVFLSIVDAKAVTTKSRNIRPAPHDLLTVRARKEGDIEKIFPDAKVIIDIHRDYLCRALIKRADVEAAIASEISNLDYGNFKDSVTEKDRRVCYSYVWELMLEWQCEIRRKQSGKV